MNHARRFSPTLLLAAGLLFATGCVSTGPQRSSGSTQEGSHRALMVAVVPNYLSKFMCADPAYRRCFGLEPGVCEAQIRRYGRSCEASALPPEKEFYTRADLHDIGVQYGRCIMDTHRKVTNRGTTDDAQCLALMPRRVDTPRAVLIPGAGLPQAPAQPPSAAPVVITVPATVSSSDAGTTNSEPPLAKTYPVTETQ